MESERRVFKNVYGLLYINKEVRELLKPYNVVPTVEYLFTDKYKEDPNQITVVIDGFGRLRSCGVPILGYVQMHDMRYVRDPNFELGKAKLAANEVTIQKPVYVATTSQPVIPSIKHLVEYNECKTLDDIKKLQESYGKELHAPKKKSLKWLRRALNMALNGPKDSKHGTGHNIKGVELQDDAT